jgi:5-methylcytosine-specific restriction endonuclease McrA
MNFEQEDKIPSEYPFQFAEPEIIAKVWEKGKIIPGYKPAEWRKDKMGKIMHFQRHGDTNSSYGWEIAHIYPKEVGGSDELSNLQPLHWQSNRENGKPPDVDLE